MQDLIEKVAEWGRQRNLTALGNLKAQTMKLVSEFGEIGTARYDGIVNDEIDGIGDTIVVAIIIGQQIGQPIKELHLLANPSSTASTFAYFKASGSLGEFVDSVLKGASSDVMVELLRRFLSDLGGYCNARNLSVIACLKAAYNEIKDRKGVMYKGAYIKESDPRYEAVCEELGLL